jgi:hypothetical protein
MCSILNIQWCKEGCKKYFNILAARLCRSISVNIWSKLSDLHNLVILFVDIASKEALHTKNPHPSNKIMICSNVLRTDL